MTEETTATQAEVAGGKQRGEFENEKVARASEALAALLSPGNRLPTLSLLRVQRNLDSFATEADRIEKKRTEMLAEMGASAKPGDKKYTFPSRDVETEFQEWWKDLLQTKVPVEFEIISTKDIEAGYYRAPNVLPDGKPNPEGGKKDPVLNWDGQYLLILLEMGVIAYPQAKVVRPEGVPGAKVVRAPVASVKKVEGEKPEEDCGCAEKKADLTKSELAQPESAGEEQVTS